MRGNITKSSATILKKYWTQAATDTAVPKLIAISAGDPTMKALLGVFNNLYMTTPKNGSVLSVDFYECQWNCYWYDRWKVEVSFCPDGNNLDGSCTILDFNRWYQDWRGASRSYNFENWITNSLNYQTSSQGFANQTASTVCATSYTTNGLFNSTDRFYKDLLKESNFSVYNYWHTHSHTHYPDYFWGGF